MFSSWIVQALSNFVTLGFCDLLLFVTVLPIPDSTVTATVLIGFWDLSDFVTIGFCDLLLFVTGFPIPNSLFNTAALLDSVTYWIL